MKKKEKNKCTEEKRGQNFPGHQHITIQASKTTTTALLPQNMAFWHKPQGTHKHWQVPLPPSPKLAPADYLCIFICITVQLLSKMQATQLQRLICDGLTFTFWLKVIQSFTSSLRQNLLSTTSAVIGLQNCTHNRPAEFVSAPSVSGVACTCSQPIEFQSVGPQCTLLRFSIYKQIHWWVQQETYIHQRYLSALTAKKISGYIFASLLPQL